MQERAAFFFPVPIPIMLTILPCSRLRVMQCKIRGGVAPTACKKGVSFFTRFAPREQIQRTHNTLNMRGVYFLVSVFP